MALLLPSIVAAVRGCVAVSVAVLLPVVAAVLGLPAVLLPGLERARAWIAAGRGVSACRGSSIRSGLFSKCIARHGRACRGLPGADAPGS